VSKDRKDYKTMTLIYDFDTNEYEFEVEPTEDDYADYLICVSVKQPEFKTKDEGSHWYNTVFNALCDVMHDSDDFRDLLDQDSDFYDYLKEKYEEEAYEAYQDDLD